MPQLGHPDTRHPDYRPDYESEQRSIEERIFDETMKAEWIDYYLYECTDYEMPDLIAALDLVALTTMKLPRNGKGSYELYRIAYRLKARISVKQSRLTSPLE